MKHACYVYRLWEIGEVELEDKGTPALYKQRRLSWEWYNTGPIPTSEQYLLTVLQPDQATC